MTIMGFKHTPTEQVQRVLRKDHLNSSESGSSRRTYYSHTELDVIIAVLRSRVDLVGYTFAKNPSTFFSTFMTNQWTSTDIKRKRT